MGIPGLCGQPLKRVRYGTFFIPSSVKVGQYKELGKNDIRALHMLAGINDSLIRLAIPKFEDHLKIRSHVRVCCLAQLNKGKEALAS